MTIDLSLRSRRITTTTLHLPPPQHTIPGATQARPQLWYVSAGTPCGLSPEAYARLIRQCPQAKDWGWKIIRR